MLAVFPRHDGARQARTRKRRRNGRATTMQHVPLHSLPQAVKAPVFVGASIYFFLLCEIPLTFASQLSAKVLPRVRTKVRIWIVY
jgi:hypothetical protein